MGSDSNAKAAIAERARKKSDAKKRSQQVGFRGCSVLGRRAACEQSLARQEKAREATALWVRTSGPAQNGPPPSGSVILGAWRCPGRSILPRKEVDLRETAERVEDSGLIARTRFCLARLHETSRAVATLHLAISDHAIRFGVWQVMYYTAFAVVIGLMGWMVYESLTAEPPKRRRPQGQQQPPGGRQFVQDNSPPGPDVLARVAIKVSEDGSQQIFLDIKHELGDLPGIQGDVDAFMRKNGVPEEYREQLMNAAQDALKQQIAQQAGGVPPGAVPGDDNWADSHVEEEEDDSPEEEEEVEVE